MARNKTAWKPNKKTTLTEAQVKKYFQAVERVNRQMRRLAAYEREKGGHITDYAYRVLQADIKSFFGPGKTRFSTADVPRDMRSYLARMNAIEAFYRMPTATITGNKEIYDKRAVTMSEKMGVPVTGDQLRKIFESGLFDELMRIYGSETALKAAGEIQEDREELKKNLNEGNKIIFSGEETELLNDSDMKIEQSFYDALSKYLKG